MLQPPSTEFVFVVGAVLVAGGLWLLIRLRRRQAVIEAGEEETAVEREFLRRQCRRRMKTSILLVVLGILVPLGAVLFSPDRPSHWLLPWLYWGGVFSLVLFMIALALWDAYQTGIHTREALRRIHSKQVILENKLRQSQAPTDRNGR